MRKGWIALVIFCGVSTVSAQDVEDAPWEEVPAAQEQAAPKNPCEQHFSDDVALTLSKLDDTEKIHLLQNLGVPAYLFLPSPNNKVQVGATYGFDFQLTPMGIGVAPQIGLDAAKALEVFLALPQRQLQRIDDQELRVIWNDFREWGFLEQTCRVYPDKPEPGFYVKQIETLVKNLRSRLDQYTASPNNDPISTLGRTENFKDHAQSAIAALGQEMEKLKEVAFEEMLTDQDTGNDERMRDVGIAQMALGRVFNGEGLSLSPQMLAAVVKVVPKKQFSEAEWNLLARSVPMGESIVRTGAMDAWRKGYTGEGVKVAVIDGGIDADHLAVYGRVTEGGNFTNSRYMEGELMGQPDNRGGHGTGVASTVLAVAPDAEIVNIKVVDRNENDQVPPELMLLSEEQQTEALVLGIEKAIELNVDVINLSMASPLPNAGSPLWDRINAALAEAITKGIVVVTASGNEQGNAAEGSNFSAMAFSSMAAWPQVIAVGSVDYFGRLSPFSSFTDVNDPSTQSVYTKPDVVSFGQGVMIARTNDQSFYLLDENQLYAPADGTSFATPHVSAIAALAIESAREQGLNPTPAFVQQALTSTAMLPESCKKDTTCEESGYGNGVASLNGVLTWIALESASVSKPKAKPHDL